MPCTATTKSGQPCKARPLKDQDTCLAHADKKTRDATGFAITGGRPPNPRAVDVLRERIEQDIDKVLNPLWDALDADRGVVVGNGPSAHVDYVPDFSARIAAARELLDRGYGKPKQTSEVSGSLGVTLADLAGLVDDAG